MQTGTDNATMAFSIIQLPDLQAREKLKNMVKKIKSIKQFSLKTLFVTKQVNESLG